MQHNPFSTRYTRPGAIPFLGSDEVDLNSIAERLIANKFRGQIVGPHGCGKTTLTFSLQARLGLPFQTVRRVAIRHARSIVTSEPEFANRPPQLLVVDGAERISAMQRWLMIQSCRKLRTGIVVTTHRRIDFLPVLCELQPTAATLRRMVEHLAPGWLIEHDDLNEIWARSGGNVRESLMELYDWFEAGRETTAHRDLRRMVSATNR